MLNYSREAIKASKPKIRVGQVVSVFEGSGYGVVTGVDPVPGYRFGTMIQFRVAVHLIDPGTGRPVECIDVDRCRHRPGCPIHATGGWDCDLLRGVFPDYDLAFYAAIRMIHPQIAGPASSGGKLIALDPEDEKLAAEIVAEWHDWPPGPKKKGKK